MPRALAEEHGGLTVRSGDTLVPAVFEGFVLEPDGAPAPGAVVMSSAGGKTVTDASGSFRLEVCVPADTVSVQLTAVSGGVKSLAATASVSPSTASGPLWVGPLLLTSGTCSPSWLPTFGGAPGTNQDIHALAVFDDGGGPALYAAGGFSTVGGVTANYIARWNGSSWSALDSGMNGSVKAMVVFDDGGGPALLAGGLFDVAFDSGDNYLARWGHGPDTTPPVLSCPPLVFARDLGSPGEVVTFAVTATDCQDPAPSVVCNPPSGSFFPRGLTLVTCTASDASGNPSTRQFPVVVQVHPVRPR